MKKLILFILIFLPAYIFSQDDHNLNEDSDEEMLLGYIDRAALSDSAYSWFKEEYNFYEPDKSSLEKITNNIEDLRITAVVGTWCSESQMFLPRLFKILELLEFNEENIMLIAVNRDKVNEALEKEKIEIEYVPTFIFYKDGKELGRIVEFPEETVEEDMAKILSGNS